MAARLGVPANSAHPRERMCMEAAAGLRIKTDMLLSGEPDTVAVSGSLCWG